MFFSLEKQIAIVTGGGSGIGLSVVKRFLEAGAKVIIADLDDSTELAASLNCESFKVDVSDEQQVQQLMPEILPILTLW